MIRSDLKKSKSAAIPSRKKDSATVTRSSKPIGHVLQKGDALKHAVVQRASEKKQHPKRSGSRWTGW